MKNRFIDYSLVKALDFFKDAIFAEDYARREGLLQMLDSRIKLVSFAFILLTVALLKNILPLFILYIISLVLAYLSRIKVMYFLKRVWIFIPLFSLFIALPALFNVFSPGEAIFFSVTRHGLFGATVFILRVLTSVSFSILLVLTTPHMSLLEALRSLGIPQIFVMVFMMCYRYIYIFIKIIEEMYLAIKVRLIGGVRSRDARKIVAWRIGVLWEKSRAMAEEVYNAMLARGYSGEPKTPGTFKLSYIDFWWLLFIISLSSFIFYLDGKNI